MQNNYRQCVIYVRIVERQITYETYLCELCKHFIGVVNASNTSFQEELQVELKKVQDKILDIEFLQACLITRSCSVLRDQVFEYHKVNREM